MKLKRSNLKKIGTIIIIIIIIIIILLLLLSPLCRELYAGNEWCF